LEGRGRRIIRRRLLRGGSDRLRKRIAGRDIRPARDQFSLAVKNKDRDLTALHRQTQLPDRAAVEIRHHIKVVPRIVRNFFGLVPGLELFRLGVQTVPDDDSRETLKGRGQLPLKINDRDVAVVRVAKITIRDKVSDGASLLFVRARDHGDDRDVTVGGGEIVSVHILKDNPVRATRSEWRHVRERGAGAQEERGEKAKAARDHLKHVGDNVAPDKSEAVATFASIIQFILS